MTDDHVDWMPSASGQILAKRAGMLRRVRCFFHDRQILEVETPVLMRTGSIDPNLDNLYCDLQTHPGQRFFLQTSPEYAMKRLLADGSPDIFQICKVFRDTELGSAHQPEFTMLEWYRKDFALDDMIGETCALIHALCRADPTQTNQSLLGAPKVYPYRELFESVTALDPLESGVRELVDYAVRNGCVTPEFENRLGDDRRAWLDLLMSHCITPELADGGLAVIHDYPANQAALARLNPDDQRFAERFEIFFAGLELANGYRELTDDGEQRRRFEIERQQRSAAGKPDIELDESLLAALAHGLPDCCGVAVGFDRLLMSLYGLTDIRQSISFALT